MGRGAHRWGLAAMLVALASAPAPASGPGRAADVPRVDRVMEHVAALTVTIGARPFDTRRSALAAGYIEEAAGQLGLAVERLPVGTVRLPRIAVGPEVFLHEAVRTFGDDNLLVRIPGRRPGPALLLMAHYDTVAGSPGAVDNAVSVGLLLEMARILAAEPPPRPVILAWPAAEEQRLAGAMTLAEALGDEVGLALSLDLVGSPGTLSLNGLSSLLGARHLRWLAAAARRAGVAVDAPIPHRVVSRLLPQVERSDHGPFTWRGVPAFHIYHRADDPVFAAYHSPWDTADRIDAGAVAGAARFLSALVHAEGPLPRAGGDQGVWVSLPGGPRVAPRAALWALELALALGAALAGVRLWRRRTRTRSPPASAGLAVHGGVFAAVWVVVSVGLYLAAAAGDHGQPWVHEPGRHVLAALVAAVALAALAMGRLGGAPVGAGRFLAVALVPLGLGGVGLAAIDAPELALGPLWAAAALGALSWCRSRAAALLLYVAALPLLWSLVQPAVLREALFHGFLPPGLPLGAYVGFAILPYWMAALYIARRWPPPSPAHPWWRRAAVAAPLLALLIAAAAVTVPEPVCSGDSYRNLGFTCEIAD